MRVCVVAEYYPRRRDPVLGVWAHRQALAAREAGAEVRVLALERPVPPAGAIRSPARLRTAIGDLARQPRRDVLDGIEVEYVRFIAPPRKGRYAGWDRWARGPLERALAHLHRSWPLDVVHAHYALPAGAAAARFTEREGLPLLVSLHGGDLLGPELRGTVARDKVAGVLLASAGVLCNSQWTLEQAAVLSGSRERMRVVHLGAEAPTELPLKRPEPTIATLGHVVGRKRHHDVLLALAELPGTRWVVIGDGPERAGLERLTAEMHLTRRVEWKGQIPPDAALRELATCHVMALPSVDEAFGVAYVEALACGVPPLGCAGEGGPEEIAAAGPGITLVPPRDPHALAETLRRVLDPPELERLAVVGRRTAADHFSWEACGQATVAAYREAAA